MKRMNFDTIYDRKCTCCAKYDYVEQEFGVKDLLPMWVADMDFSCPPEIFQAISKRMEHPIMGYTKCSDGLRNTIVEKLKKDFNWDIKPEWIVLNFNVLQAITTSLQITTTVGDDILLQTPVYYPFFSLIKNNGRQVTENPLIYKNNSYSMDFEHLRKKLEISNHFGGNKHRIRAAILCNPHNPVGKAYTKEELLEFGKICLDNNITILSDEIHSDLIFKGHKHTPIASLSKELEQNTITYMSGSKSFNIAGFAIAYAIIPNDTLRQRFCEVSSPQPSVLSIVGLEAGIKAGADYYIEELMEYVEGNFNYLKEFINTKIPKLTVVQAEATYLAWIDCSKLEISREQLVDVILNKAKLALDYGYVFGTGGDDFIRINIATPKVNVQKALEQLEQAINSL